jgi:molecular chaperone DnaK (HSP70)
MDELGKANDREAQAKLEKTDGFVKFLSDSRDWSFTYIENVQQAIQGLVKAMKANDKAKILESYNELQNFLPTEEDSNKKQGDNK